METAIKEIEKQGRITIPKEWRDELGLAPRCRVKLIKRGHEILIIPISSNKSLLSLYGKIKPLKRGECIDDAITRGMAKELKEEGLL